MTLTKMHQTIIFNFIRIKMPRGKAAKKTKPTRKVRGRKPLNKRSNNKKNQKKDEVKEPKVVHTRKEETDWRVHVYPDPKTSKIRYYGKLGAQLLTSGRTKQNFDKLLGGNQIGHKQAKTIVNFDAYHWHTKKHEELLNEIKENNQSKDFIGESTENYFDESNILYSSLLKNLKIHVENENYNHNILKNDMLKSIDKELYRLKYPFKTPTKFELSKKLKDRERLLNHILFLLKGNTNVDNCQTISNDICQYVNNLQTEPMKIIII